MTSVSNVVSKLTVLPRSIIILIDLAVISLSTLLGYALRFNFNWPEILSFHPAIGVPANVISGLIAILVTKSYAGIVRYTSIDDGIRLTYASLLSLVSISIVNLLYHYNFERNLIPYSVLLISFFVSFLFLLYYRLIVKNVFAFYKSSIGERANVIVYGAGQSGIITKQMIDSDPKSKQKVVAFIEDDVKKAGKEVLGVKIFSAADDLQKLFKQYNVRELIIAIKDLSYERKNEIVDQCLRSHVRIRTVPPIDKWVQGELSLKQIKEINIEDLLGRESIKLGDEVLKELTLKRICVTGAAGSIGSEIVRQVMLYNPSELLLIDQAESPLYEIEREIQPLLKGGCKLAVFVADISNKRRIHTIFESYRPDIIFHAAAYKHVPMMEGNPTEAVICNILGTKILADLAIEHHVKKFVMISTDKAVNPTSVMGCSKRIAEIYVQSLNKHFAGDGNESTAFVTTRFGNVLGSNGSVIPLFKRQIAAGGPITVTHADITRYFMTIPEACRLVLEAGTMGRGGEVYIFDMGRPIRIAELAEKMVRLSGFEPNKDIDIVYTGLREGEKLFEELLNDKENTIPTHHEKILKAKVREYEYTQVNLMIELFEDLVLEKNEFKAVALMKEIVPEFKSNYSRYEVLDESR